MLDASTIVGAVLRPRSVPKRAFDRLFAGYEVVVSRPMLNELEEVILRAKFDAYVRLEDRLAFVQSFAHRATVVEVDQSIVACRDPDDDKYLSLAVAAGAQVIVSSDADLLALDPFRGIRILSPRDFLQSSDKETT